MSYLIIFESVLMPTFKLKNVQIKEKKTVYSELTKAFSSVFKTRKNPKNPRVLIQNSGRVRVYAKLQNSGLGRVG